MLEVKQRLNLHLNLHIPTDTNHLFRRPFCRLIQENLQGAEDEIDHAKRAECFLSVDGFGLALNFGLEKC